MELEELQSKFDKGEYKQVIQIINEINGNTFENQYLLIKSYNKLDQIKKAAVQAKHVYSEISSLTQIQKLKILYELIWSLYRLADYENARKYVDEGMEIVNSMNFDTQSLENKKTISSIINHAGIIQYYFGNYESAKDHYLRIINIGKEIENEYLIQAAQVNLGLISKEKGKYQNALDFFKKGLELAEKNNDLKHIRVASNNLSQLYSLLGKLQKAEGYAKQSIQVTENLEDNWGRAVALTTLGRIYYKKDENNKALTSLNNALEIMKNFDNQYEICKSLFYTLLIHLKQNDRGEARNILRKIKKNSKINNTSRVALFYDIGKAIYLKNSHLYSHKIKAENKLRAIIRKEISIEGDIIIIAFLNLIELLIEQLPEEETDQLEHEEEKILNEIKKFHEIISQIAKKQNVPELELQAYYIRAHLNLLDLQFDKVIDNLDRAAQISEECGLKTVTISQPNLKQDKYEITTVGDAFPYDLRQSVNKIVHTLPRLKIMIALMKYNKMLFSELKETVGLSAGNLGNHCNKLIETGYIQKQKEIVKDRFLTTYTLTPEGIAEFQKYSSIIKPHLEERL